MKLISTEDMVIVGPGSEWFWTAFSAIVVAVTLLVIFRQLRIQANQAAIENLDKRSREYGSERMVRCKLEILTALRDGSDPAHLPSAFAEPMMIHWELIGRAVRNGHLTKKSVWETNANQVRMAWGLLSPTIRRWRADGEGPTLFEDFEWLAVTMDRIDRRAGVTDEYEDMQRDELDSLITKFQSQIRMYEALRTVVIAKPGENALGTVAPILAAPEPS